MRVLLATLTLALVGASPAAAERIEVVAHVQKAHSVQFAPNGRAGNVDFAQWVIRDRYGRAIGDMLTDCRWVTGSLRLCVGQMTLPRGVIAMLGASRTPFLGQLAVVGGTGLYEGASGTMLFKATGRSRYVLSVTYDKEA